MITTTMIMVRSNSLRRHVFHGSHPCHQLRYLETLFYKFQRASIWLSLVLLPFSKRYWINPKLLCKRCLGRSESSASSTQFVCECYGRRKWIIAQELDNLWKIVNLGEGYV